MNAGQINRLSQFADYEGDYDVRDIVVGLDLDLDISVQ